MSNENFKYQIKNTLLKRIHFAPITYVGKSRGEIIFEIVQHSFEGQAKMHNKIQQGRLNRLFELAGGSKDQRSISKSLSSLLLPTLLGIRSPNLTHVIKF